MGMFDERTITARVSGFTHSYGFMGHVITFSFYDGRTLRGLEFSENSAARPLEIGERLERDYKNGDKIHLVKVGSGKYAGYRL